MTTVEVLFARFQEKMKPSAWERWLATLPRTLHSSILRYRRWQDQQLHLFGKLLLKKGAQAAGAAGALESLQTDINERPFCDGPIDFNISHAGEVAVCAVGCGVRLGIDVEKVAEIDFGAYESYMTADEWRRIEASARPLREFFTYWTIKESVMKADGRGMDIPLETILVREGFARLDLRRWRLHAVPLCPGYVCHLATDRAGVEVSVGEVVFD